MNYQEFLIHIKTAIQQTLGENTRLSIQRIEKNNGVHYDGLIIMRPGYNISPTIFLNAYYHRYLEGVMLDDIYQDIINTYYAKLPSKNFDTEFFLDYDKVRPRIIPKLINYDRNHELLKKLPHFRYLDLAVVFQCLVNASGNEQASILIHNRHASHWKASTEDLYEAALANGPLLQPYQMSRLSDLLNTEPYPSHNENLSDRQVSEEEQPPMYVLTNQVRINGAATILYRGLLHQLSTYFDSDLVILPSSIHEVLLVPFAASPSSPGADLSYYTQMVQEVNETQVVDDEILSNNAYFYSQKEDMLRLI